MQGELLLQTGWQHFRCFHLQVWASSTNTCPSRCNPLYCTGGRTLLLSLPGGLQTIYEVSLDTTRAEAFLLQRTLQLCNSELAHQGRRH